MHGFAMYYVETSQLSLVGNRKRFHCWVWAVRIQNPREFSNRANVVAFEYFGIVYFVMIVKHWSKLARNLVFVSIRFVVEVV